MSADLLLTDSQAFRDRVEHSSSMPHFGLVRQISEMASDPDVSLQAVAEVIGRDMLLTGRLLRMINSPLYGFPRKISTVSQALILLGIDVLKGLIASTILETMPPITHPLWRHSILVSRTCRRFAELLKVRDTEEYAVLGLLHDIGKAAFFVEARTEYRELIERAEKEKTTIVSLEQSALGYTHADVGLWLATRWALPEKLAEPIALHHKPGLSQAHRQRTLALAAADGVVRELGGGAERTPSEKIPGWILEELRITESQLSVILEETKSDVAAVKSSTPGGGG